MARRPRASAAELAQAPALTPAQTRALDRDGDGAAGSLPKGEQRVAVTEAGGGQISDGAGGRHVAGAALVITDAQAVSLRASGFVL